MSLVNYHTKEINCKIVYYGPGLGGKTTNIQYIYQKTHPKLKSQMVSLNTDNDRTLFFDFLPLDLGVIRDFRTRFHLYTVPGQVFYEASRRLILRGLDGIVFVADSQVERMEANLESFEGLKKHLREQGVSLEEIPFVIQYNKRDLPNVSSLEEMSKMFNSFKAPEFQASALNGEGVFETLKTISKLVLLNIKTGLKPETQATS